MKFTNIFRFWSSLGTMSLWRDSAVWRSQLARRSSCSLPSGDTPLSCLPCHSLDGVATWPRVVLWPVDMTIFPRYGRNMAEFNLALLWSKTYSHGYLPHSVYLRFLVLVGVEQEVLHVVCLCLQLPDALGHERLLLHQDCEGCCDARSRPQGPGQEDERWQSQVINQYLSYEVLKLLHYSI